MSSAIEWAIDNQMHVINISIGSCSSSLPSFIETIYYSAANAGIAIVASAGNGAGDGTTCANGPVSKWANHPAAIAVTAHRPAGAYPSGYQYGNEVDYSAPDSVLTLVSGGLPVVLMGTSVAAPHVAGAVAVLRGAGFTTLLSIRQRLNLGSLGPTGDPTHYGNGKINVYRSANGVTVSISGPGSGQGWKTWAAVTDRGGPPFTYSWQRIDWCTGQQSYSSSSTYSEYITLESSFILNLTVTDTAMGMTAQASKPVGMFGPC